MIIQQIPVGVYALKYYKKRMITRLPVHPAVKAPGGHPLSVCMIPQERLFVKLHGFCFPGVYSIRWLHLLFSYDEECYRYYQQIVTQARFVNPEA